MTASALLLALVTVAPPEPPALLRQCLARHPSLSVLSATDLRPGEYTAEEIKEFGYWPPWIVADLDHDGRPDVAAVVVKRVEGESLFGVVAVHARSPDTLHWVWGLSKDSLHGVTTGPAGDTLMPLHCIECDANAWYRWSGTSYESHLYKPGETIAVATYGEVPRLGLLVRPDRGSRLFAEVAPCTTAKVLRAKGGAFETRWYFVEVESPKLVRGWLPAAWAADSACIG